MSRKGKDPMTKVHRDDLVTMARKCGIRGGHNGYNQPYRNKRWLCNQIGGLVDLPADVVAQELAPVSSTDLSSPPFVPVDESDYQTICYKVPRKGAPPLPPDAWVAANDKCGPPTPLAPSAPSIPIAPPMPPAPKKSHKKSKVAE